MKFFKLFPLFILFVSTVSVSYAQVQYTMPTEDQLHEGTWLQWPHQYEYGLNYRNRLDSTWIAMTQALVTSEKVHIIAYNGSEQNRIINLLSGAGVSLSNIDFYLFETNDVWIRDSGPVFVNDSIGNLLIEDWGFNGWGGKFNSSLCDVIPDSIANHISMPRIDLNNVMTIEGGAVEQDGHGVFLGTKSSMLSQSPANTVRNPGMTQLQAENILTQYLGVTKFIWLNGLTGHGDITDMHVDGFAKFLNDTTIVTMNDNDLNYWYLPAADILTLHNATNLNNHPYHLIYLPLTANNVVTTYGAHLGYKGDYINYYVANTVVLVPNYNDANDAVANNLIQSLYPGRTVIGIDVRNLYANGGMVHCVTQQQPLSVSTGNIFPQPSNLKILFAPNPFTDYSTLYYDLGNDNEANLVIRNMLGQIVFTSSLQNQNGQVQIGDELPAGVYFGQIESHSSNSKVVRFVKAD